MIVIKKCGCQLSKEVLPIMSFAIQKQWLKILNKWFLNCGSQCIFRRVCEVLDFQCKICQNELNLASKMRGKTKYY